jgi:hypothetical protein
VAWHLSPASGRIFGSAYRRQKHILGGYAKSETQGAVTVVRNEPVIAGLHNERCDDEHCLVTRTRDLKKDSVLGLELQLFIVYSPRHVHQAIDLEHGVAVKAVVFFYLRLTGHQ